MSARVGAFQIGHFVVRTALAGSIAVVLALASAQAAERRMFIIPNDADAYGVDRCLAQGEHCGTAAANSYCKTHSYSQAASYRKVDREEITGAIPGVDSCRGPKCPDLVAIVCTR